jgi:hypothetical protein
MIRVVLLDYASDGLCNRFVVPSEVECLISTRGSRKNLSGPLVVMVATRWYSTGRMHFRRKVVFSKVSKAVIGQIRRL